MFWSCCTERTRKYDELMSQPGCSSGNHRWTIRTGEIAVSADQELLAATLKCCTFCLETAEEETTLQRLTHLTEHCVGLDEAGKKKYRDLRKSMCIRFLLQYETAQSNFERPYCLIRK